MTTTNQTINAETAVTDNRRYLRLILRSAERGKLYKKDFEARHIFDHMVTHFVSDLIHDGTIHEGEHYYGLIIPRYGKYLRPRPNLESNEEKVKEIRPWLSLEFEEGVQPDRKINYFTLELRVKDRSLIYREDFSLRELGSFFERIATALIRLGVLRKRSLLVTADKDFGDLILQQSLLTGSEIIHTELFAREDDEADFERDEVYALEAEAGELVQLVEEPVDMVADELPIRSLNDYDIQETVGGDMAEGDAKILISRPALTAIQQVARRGAQVEEGGVLVGRIFRNGENRGFLVEIADHIFSEEARGTKFELRYTFEAWQKRSIQLKERFPDYRIVGWYHTHLVKMQSLGKDDQVIYETELFFSRDDHFMHRQFFPEKWYVAMVLNPSGESTFFNWSGDSIVQAPGFFVYNPKLVPEIVNSESTQS